MESTEHDATWATLPGKGQLLILCFARIADPSARISIMTYLYYQLKSLDDTLSSGQIVQQAAALQTVFTLAQCSTAMFLGRLADSRRGGRKLVLMVGLGGSFLSCLGFGFVQKFYQAMVLRVIEGAVNGNVAVTRTMVGEIVREKRFFSRAFLLMPICFNVAAICSPLVAAQLVNLSDQYPEALGHSVFLKRFPYAPPALLNGIVLLLVLLGVFFFMEETLEPLRGRHDRGIAISSRALLFMRSWHKNTKTLKQTVDEEIHPMLYMPIETELPELPSETFKDLPKPVLPLRRMFTTNLVLTILCQVFTESHISAYNNLWPSFLSDSVSDNTSQRLPFRFSGGAGMTPKDISWTIAFFGMVGIPAQVLLYPRVTHRLGTLKTWQTFLRVLPLVYFIIPYISTMPSNEPPPASKSGFAVWAVIILVKLLLVVGTTFVMPAQVTLTNNASPHPSALARTHSLCFMVGTVIQSITLLTGGAIYSYGSSHNAVGLVWWTLSLIAAVVCIISFWVREGNGHEIWLTGDEE